MQRSLRARALSEGWSGRVSDHAKISQFTVQELLGQQALRRARETAARVAKHSQRPGLKPRLTRRAGGLLPRLVHPLVFQLARAQGVSPATAQRIWARHGLKPRLAGRLQGMQGAASGCARQSV